jgi:hypothetical protein
MRQEYFDEVSFEYTRAIAAKLRADPALFDIVRNNMHARRARVDQGHNNERYYCEQWEALVRSGLDACLSKALEESEDAVAMRHTAPFQGILTQPERMAVRDRVLIKYEPVRA